MRRTAFLILSLVAVPLAAQNRATDGAADTSPAGAAAAGVIAGSSAVAVRATAAHTLTAREDDLLWRNAPLIDGFRVFDPKEDGDPSMRTTARIAYDAKNLYILVRAYDPHPDSIVALLSRRDVRTESEWLKVMIDSYHDKRNGYEMAVNPAGVKRDYAIYNDQNEDEGWDGIWDVATRVDKDGWVAEFRIPFSQLRFPNAPTHTFGIMIWRDIARTHERQSWPAYRRTKPGITSQFGDVSGIDGIETPRRAEFTPYVVTKNFQQERDFATSTSYDRITQQTLGADLKIGLSSNLTLDATINPDFGQVEADPSTLNLSAFEQFFAERRPFFTEGAGIFNGFSLSCNNGQCSGLLYPRRIGRSPQLSGWYGDATTPGFTPITAAAKISGKLPSGLSIGFLDAVTEQVKAPGGQTVEPQANYFVGRLLQDFRGGTTAVGTMFTATNRQLDGWSDSLLRKSAYTGGVDARTKFAENNYELSGWVLGSIANGTAPAIARLQQSSVHYYDRVGSGLPYDTTRTSLSGTGYQIEINKSGGGITRFDFSYQRLSPGFEPNDLGFLTRTDQQSLNGYYAFNFEKPNKLYRRLYLNFNGWRQWNDAGLPTNFGWNVNSYMELANYWGVFWGFNQQNAGLESFDDRFARGGPAVRRAPQNDAWLGFNGDPRGAFAANWFSEAWDGDDGHTHGVYLQPNVNFRASSRFQGNLSVSYSRNVNDTQWFENDGAIGNDTTHYTFARLEQQTLNMTLRLDYTVTPTLTVQVYGSPFATSGHYTNWRELSNPTALRYDDRFKPYAGDPSSGDFNFKQFRSNTVLRWEYRPGSTLFLVWTQGRTQSDVDLGLFSAGHDMKNLFMTQPNNTFLVKWSYWYAL
jgi:hypothetical protein